MKLGLAQVDPTVGDLGGNLDLCRQAMAEAATQGAELLVLPELCVTGYPPRDILNDTNFTRAAGAALIDLAAAVPLGLSVLVGSVAEADARQPRHPSLYNAAFLLQGGKVRLVAAKRLLPAYDVFHEPRWFLPGPSLPPVEVAGLRLGVLICEDLWDEGYPLHPPAELIAAGAEALVCLSASPYRQGIQGERLRHARRAGCPLVYVNLVGATDELIFDGRSFVLDGGGRLALEMDGFEPQVKVVDFPLSAPAADPVPSAGIEAELFSALTLGMRDFVRKNELPRAFLGLSGGVDSAVAACLASEALGPSRVTGVAIPSRFSDPRSTESARELAARLGIGFEVVPLEPLHAAAEVSLPGLEGVAAENVQARLRMLILMSFVNRRGGFLLNTSNKTELSLGYSTLYGDMAGSLSPLGDLTKPEVYALARHLNAAQPGLIPAFILEREPSAELTPGQVDPFDYEAISPAIEELVRSDRSDAALRRSEHKRWQMGVVLKVSERAFGTGRLMPIARR